MTIIDSTRIIIEAALIPSPAVRALAKYVIDASAENADDTLFAENDLRNTWDKVFFGTMQFVLVDFCGRDCITVPHHTNEAGKTYRITDSLKAEVREWFLNHGVPF